MKSFLLDEHIPRYFRTQLLRHQPDLVVWIIGDEGAPPKETPDPEILRWCETRDFLLVTNNRRTMPVHLAAHLAEGGHVPGVLEVDLTAPVGAIIEDLLLIAEAAREDEYQDRIEYLPLQSASGPSSLS